MKYYESCYLCHENVLVDNASQKNRKFHCKICKLKIKHFGPLYHCDLNRSGECTQSKPCLHRVHDPIFIDGKYMFDNDIKNIKGQGKIGERDPGRDRYYTCFSIIPLIYLGKD
jgi:hypothetical protein